MQTEKKKAAVIEIRFVLRQEPTRRCVEQTIWKNKPT